MKTDYTFVLARVFGPLMAVAGLMLIMQPARMRTTLVSFIIDDALLMFAGFMTLGLGLLLVAVHQRWDSFTACFISLIGWLMLIRGGVLLLAPDLVRQAVQYIDAQPMLFPITGCAVALIGVWLTYSGYVAGTLRADTDR